MKKMVYSSIFLFFIIISQACQNKSESIMIVGPQSIRIGEENSIQYEAFITNSNEPVNEKWICSDESVATIDSNGNLTGLEAGKVVTITYISGEGKNKMKISKDIRVINKNEVLVHYFRFPLETELDDTVNQYTNWGLHLWWCNKDGEYMGNYTTQEGTDVTWDKPFQPIQESIKDSYTPLEDDFGIQYLLELPASYSEHENTTIQNYSTLKFITHEADNKDGGDREFPDLRENHEIWLVEGIGTVFTSRPNITMKSARMINEESISIEFLETKNLDPEQFIIIDNDNNQLDIKDIEISNDGLVTLFAELSIPNSPYTVSYLGKELKVTMKADALDTYFTYDGDDLGVQLLNGSANFKLWAPLASEVNVFLYNKDNKMEEAGIFSLIREERGVWSTTINPEDLTDNNINSLEGYFYQYEVTNNGRTKRVLDPYTKSMAEFTVQTSGSAGADGDKVGKGVIIDPSRIGKVSGFANIPGYRKREDAIIYEIHVRDFTSGLKIENPELENFGTFTAFIEKLPYLKSLGVTHIQLLPVQASYYGDESKRNEIEDSYRSRNSNYNWGYDPHNYFSLDGMYSEDSQNPELRIAEFKQLVEAIHQLGMGVTLDVVYNHTAKTEILNDIVPGYYYRLNSDGSYISNSGCGNDIATEHIMARKLIIDSILYWIDEYKIDGLRFDLMGLMDRETIREAYNKAKLLNPDILFVGEGWYMNSGNIWADQGWQTQNDIEGEEIVAMFDDDFRDMLKGGGLDEDKRGFIQNLAVEIVPLFNNIKGIITQSETRIENDSNAPFTSDDPGDCLQYIAAHDGLTLHDKMAYNLNLDPADETDSNEIFKRLKLGNLFILTSQGISFLHGGQEMGRTKEFKAGNSQGETISNSINKFVYNSYDASDIINRIDWSLTTSNINSQELLAFTTGLIEIRKATDAFRLGSHRDIERNCTLLSSTNIDDKDVAIAFKSIASTGESFYVIINADTISRQFSFSEKLDDGIVIVDSNEANIEGVTNVTGAIINQKTITVEPLTAIVIKK